MGFSNRPSMDFLKGELPKPLSEQIENILIQNKMVDSDPDVIKDPRMIHRATMEMLKIFSSTLSINKSIDSTSARLEDRKARLHDILDGILDKNVPKPMAFYEGSSESKGPWTPEESKKPLNPEEKFEENIRKFHHEILFNQRGIFLAHKEFVDELYQHLGSQRQLLYEAQKCLSNVKKLLENKAFYMEEIDTNPIELNFMESYLPLLTSHIQMLEGNMAGGIKTLLNQAPAVLHKSSVVVTESGKIKEKKYSDDFKGIILGTMTPAELEEWKNSKSKGKKK